MSKFDNTPRVVKLRARDSSRPASTSPENPSDAGRFFDEDGIERITGWRLALIWGGFVVGGWATVLLLGSGLYLVFRWAAS